MGTGWLILVGWLIVFFVFAAVSLKFLVGLGFIGRMIVNYIEARFVSHFDAGQTHPGLMISWGKLNHQSRWF